MEGNTYICRWKRSAAGFVLWLRDHEALEVVHEDFEEASDELASQIALWNGDKEAVLEFDPPPPIGGEADLDRRLLTLGYNESVRCVNRSPTLFADLCSHCEFGIGARTDEPLEVNTLPRGHIAGVDRLYPPSLLFSDAFVALLTDSERTALDLRPVVARKGRRPFFELVGNAVGTAVGVQGATYPTPFLQSWVCNRCQRRVFTVDHPTFPDIHTFLAASSLPNPLPSVFAFEAGGRIELAATPDRWDELRPNKSAKGISTATVGVIADHLVETVPDLPAPREFDWML